MRHQQAAKSAPTSFFHICPMVLLCIGALMLASSPSNAAESVGEREKKHVYIAEVSFDALLFAKGNQCCRGCVHFPTNEDRVEVQMFVKEGDAKVTEFHKTSTWGALKEGGTHVFERKRAECDAEIFGLHGKPVDIAIKLNGKEVASTECCRTLQNLQTQFHSEQIYTSHVITSIIKVGYAKRD